jgi:hypothetical protein
MALNFKRDFVTFHYVQRGKPVLLHFYCVTKDKLCKSAINFVAKESRHLIEASNESIKRTRICYFNAAIGTESLLGARLMPYLLSNLIIAGFEVLRAVSTESIIVWHATPHGLVKVHVEWRLLGCGAV